jgi:putative methyltransferase
MARNAQALLDMASAILWTNATQKSTGLKNLLYDANIQAGQRSMLIALVNGAHKEREQLFACAEEEGFLLALPEHLQPHTSRECSFHIQVALYEALLGSRRVRGTSELVDFVKTRKQSLQMTLAARRKRGATHSYVPRIRMPRYVRVNHLRLTMVEAVDYMKSFGYTQVVVPLSNTTNSNNYTSILAPNTFLVDPVIPSLFMLPPSTSFHGDAHVDAGALVLQDRSSCLTALALSPLPPNAHVIDTCSAPGNKTLQVASIMMGSNTNCTGTIAAFERSENRFTTLSKRIHLQGASGFVTPIMRDFMTVDTTAEYPNVSHILIDPSCSGSGLVLAVATNGETPGEAEHETMANESVAALAKEQLALILHAMSLPSARVIAYSTCSIHRAENEDVVISVLAAQKDWHLVQAVPQWPHRGLDLPEFAQIKEKVCRANFEKDGTNGFFVARFERVVLPVAAADGEEIGVSKKEKQKKKKSKRDDDDDDESSPKKKSKKEKKRKVEELSGDDDKDDDDNDAAVKSSEKKAKKKSKGRESETKEERRERKAAKKKKKRSKDE